MSAEENHSGIPTRAIHEAYLDMHRALKAYREAKDQQNQHGIQTAHGEFQQGVLTMYEMLRPHLKKEEALQEYWYGKPPEYPENGQPPDPKNGKGVIQWQKKTDPKSLGDLRPDQYETLKEWHTAFGYNGNKRIIGLAGMGDTVVVTFHEYQIGLQELDDWETKYHRVVERKDGFMNKQRETRIKRQRIPIDRLKNAARELSEVANELTLLSDVEASGTDIIRNFDQSGDESQAELDNVDYNGSPDL